MKYVHYRGEFVSQQGTAYRVEIMQEAEEAFAQVGELHFPAESPLLIEWAETQKEEVICGSTATLKLLSPGDRTYTDLYSIEPGRIRLDVYRKDKLYWSGCLDTEFYEEPYEQYSLYELSLTFSDFGVLERLNWEGEGLVTLRQIWQLCMDRAGLPYVSYYWDLDQSGISTLAPSGTRMLKLDDIKVRSDNFYDEDGEPSTLKDVLEGVLQPLALRMVQRGGKVWIYDLNGLFNKDLQPTAIQWNGDSQTLSTDVVYNNVRITWSPYCQSGNLFPTTCWKEDIPTDANLYNLTTPEGVTSDDSRARYFSFHNANTLKNWTNLGEMPGFTLWTSQEGENCTLLDEGLRFFRIVAQENGEETEGVMVQHPFLKADRSNERVYVYQHGYVREDDSFVFFGPMFAPSKRLLRFDPVWLPQVSNVNNTGLQIYGKKGLFLRISIKMLLDPRHNPFIDAKDFGWTWYKVDENGNPRENDSYPKQKKTYDSWKNAYNFFYMPVRITFTPDSGGGRWVWRNRQPEKKYPSDFHETLGEWYWDTEDTDTPDDEQVEPSGYFCWCDIKNYKDSTGLLGFKSNVPTRAPYYAKGSFAIANRALLQKLDDGQYIPYPGRESGFLSIEVLSSDWFCFAAKEGGESLSAGVLFLGKHSTEWALLQMPEVEVVTGSIYGNSTDSDDVEYSAALNPAAREELELDTICGTKAGTIPMARGAYFSSSSGSQITSFTRAGRTAQAEDLLIGTLYSQYAQRRTRLSGEAWILADTPTTYCDTNLSGVRLLLTEDLQDLQSDTSEVILTELRPDEYTRKEE